MSLSHRVFVTPCLCHTVSLSHRVFVTPCLCHTVSLTRRVFVPPCLCHTVSLSHRVFDPPCLCPTVSLSHRVFVPPCLCPTVSLSHRVFVTPCLCHTVSLSHRVFDPPCLEMKRYQWNILVLGEVGRKNFRKTSTPEGHKLFCSGREDRHEHRVGCLIHKDAVSVIMEGRPDSSRLITILLKASPFNITIIQAYVPTTDYDDDDIEDFYDQVKEVIDQVPKKDTLVVQGDWNAKIGEDASKNWKGIYGQYCNPETNERGLRLLEFVSYNNLKVVNTFGPHKPFRCWTWHSPGGDYHNQIDYIMVKRRFKSSVNIAKTRSFPGADIGNDHELVMMTFRLRLQRVISQSSIRTRFNLEKR